MKILHVSTYDSGGGAARAAYRIHRALVEFGIDSRMRVLHGGTGDNSIKSGALRPITARLFEMLRSRLIVRLNKRWQTDNTTLHTFGYISAGLVEELNASDADVLHLHWISNILSVADIGRLKKPIVWTLHDMWAFCGGEHYAPDNDASRFREGYLSNNRPLRERGPDLNRRTWMTKRRAWNQQRFNIVSPSQWLAGCARESVLLNNSRIHIIPNCLDTLHTWRPIPRSVARSALNLPIDKNLIMFGADGGVADPRKGLALLREALEMTLAKKSKPVELLVFGHSDTRDRGEWPCHVHWLGSVRDDRVLVLAYSAADVMVVPSRQDNLPNTAIEAQACGTPVAAFNVGGLPDIVYHRKTGWLAKPFDVTDLADGLMWLIQDEGRQRALGEAARVHAVERFSESVVAGKYADLFHKVISQ